MSMKITESLQRFSDMRNPFNLLFYAKVKALVCIFVVDLKFVIF